MRRFAASVVAASLAASLAASPAFADREHPEHPERPRNMPCTCIALPRALEVKLIGGTARDEFVQAVVRRLRDNPRAIDNCLKSSGADEVEISLSFAAGSRGGAVRARGSAALVECLERGGEWQFYPAAPRATQVRVHVAVPGFAARRAREAKRHAPRRW